MNALLGAGKGSLPVILQAERSECGLACLAMILAYFGHRIELNTLRTRFQVSQHGLTLKSLVSLAGNLNLVARPLRLDMADMQRLKTPAILHWDLNHFVILKSVRRRSLVIHDPANGKQVVSLAQAGKHFTGIAVELMPTPVFRPQEEICKLKLSDLWHGCDGLCGGLAQLLGLSLLLQLFAIALPFYTQVLLDDVLVNHDLDLLKLLAGGFLLLVLFRSLTELVRGFTVISLGNRISFQFATRLCRHLLHLPQAYFSRRHIGDVVSRFGSLENVREFLCSGIVEIVIDGVMVSCTLVLMFVYSGQLTTIALAAVVLYGMLRVLTYRAMHARNEAWITDKARENTHFMENISAIQGIKLYGRENARLASWQNCFSASLNAGIRVQKLGLHLQFAHGLLTGAENIILLMVGSYAVLNGSMTVGMLLAFISFKDHLYRSVFSLLDKFFEFRLLDVHLGRLADIAFSEAEGLPARESTMATSYTAPAMIRLEGIGFRHSADSPMLFTNVTLEIPDHKVVAIIGPTGCGKSTLLKIVASLIRPQEGKLVLDGNPVTSGNLAEYRKRVAGVMQDDRLLSGTILENITFFDSMPDFARAEAAARTANVAAEIARMPMQFNTMVGAMGAALSGGQAQRILLARAIYKQPGLLVLDEATSHLDIETEKQVNRALKDLGLPTLVVAHRPETVCQADAVYCLQPTGLAPVEHREFRRLLSK